MLLLTSGLRAQTVSEVIWSTAAQRWVSYAELVQTLRAADLVFLGEQHDNQAHHETRARLVADLSRPGLTLVFEQLPAQGRFTIPPQEPDLLTVLRVQGFQEKAWAWPMHAPLFAVAQRLAIPLSGGNIQSGLGRRVYAEGPQALPIEIQQALASAPLQGAALSALDSALVEGHCGKLPAAMLPVMRLIQQATDLSLVMTAHAQRPSVVIAGNGHVQKTFGMPHAARRLFPAARQWSVGFLEGAPTVHVTQGVDREQPAKTQTPPASEDQERYDFIWSTPGVDREDPCAGFSLGGSR